MRRLYLSIYLALVGHLLLFGVLATIVVTLHEDGGEWRRIVEGMSETVDEILPGADVPATEMQDALARLRARFALELTVRDATGAVVASAGRVLAAAADADDEGFSRVRVERGRNARVFHVRLSGDRTLAATREHPRERRWLAPVVMFLVLLALVAHPVARRITRRLERLQTRVDQLGQGDLAARVQVEGRDEIASLAGSFNRAAERIETLVGAQRTMLAAASHELRSPIARIRMALELFERDATPALRARIERDVAELDALIEELLLASRLQANDGLGETGPIDLLGLAAEEAARVGADVAGEPLVVDGSARLLRHLVRNVIQNALRHGAPPIEVRVAPAHGCAVLRVADRGPGIAEAEREAIFRPFYRPPGAAETGEGVGLGLAIVREIARRHGGDARCLDRAGGGTVVEVRLPLGGGSGG